MSEQLTNAGADTVGTIVGGWSKDDHVHTGVQKMVIEAGATFAVEGWMADYNAWRLRKVGELTPIAMRTIDVREVFGVALEEPQAAIDARLYEQGRAPQSFVDQLEEAIDDALYRAAKQRVTPALTPEQALARGITTHPTPAGVQQAMDDVVASWSSPVAKLRNRLGLSQEQLAEQAGVNRRTVIRMETGKGASDESAKKVAKALGVNVRELLDGVLA